MDTINVNNSRSKIHPHKLALWLACISMSMMFMAWTSAYIVRQGAGSWVDFKLPSLFFVNTVILLMSSATLQGSFMSFKRGNEWAYKGLLVATFVLGVLFVVMQYQAWLQLNRVGITLTGNPSGSFVYVLSGFHALHVVAGVAVLITAMIHAFALKFKVSDRRIRRFDLTVNFWHFVDILWIYLLVFLVSQR
jgi:cytochrome c oxidase subunit III